MARLYQQKGMTMSLLPEERMGLLEVKKSDGREGKKILITGMISNRSIAYSIAQSCRREGAELAFTYVVDKLEDRVREMASSVRVPAPARPMARVARCMRAAMAPKKGR